MLSGPSLYGTYLAGINTFWEYTDAILVFYDYETTDTQTKKKYNRGTALERSVEKYLEEGPGNFIPTYDWSPYLHSSR